MAKAAAEQKSDASNFCPGVPSEPGPCAAKATALPALLGKGWRCSFTICPSPWCSPGGQQRVSFAWDPPHHTCASDKTAGKPLVRMSHRRVHYGGLIHHQSLPRSQFCLPCLLWEETEVAKILAVWDMHPSSALCALGSRPYAVTDTSKSQVVTLFLGPTRLVYASQAGATACTRPLWVIQAGPWGVAVSSCWTLVKHPAVICHCSWLSFSICFLSLMSILMFPASYSLCTFREKCFWLTFLFHHDTF